LGLFGSDPPQDVDSVLAGKVSIENQQVIIEFGCQSSGLVAIVRHVHGVVLCFEPSSHEPSECRITFGNQNAHLARRPIANSEKSRHLPAVSGKRKSCDQ
jgi:hypothetical protein